MPRRQKRKMKNRSSRKLILCSSVLLGLANYLISCGHSLREQNVYWQAHRGGGAHEAPENTLSAFHYAWTLGGIPEADVRTTKDGVMICLHDATLARTTNAPAAICSVRVENLTYDDILRCEVNKGFSDQFLEEKVPRLNSVLTALQVNPDRQMYLDIKDVDLEKLGRLIDSLGVGKQIIFTSSKQEKCQAFKNLAQHVRTMLWIGGSAEEIEKKFAAAHSNHFKGLDQVQVHLNDKKDTAGWRYELDAAFLKNALKITKKYGCDLQVFVKQFTESDLFTLLDLGIRWYATDEPKRFSQTVQAWRERR